MARTAARYILRGSSKIVRVAKESARFVKVHWSIIKQVLFFSFWFTAFWGAFEFAYDLYEAGEIFHPIWSTTWGTIIFYGVEIRPPHHWVISFIGMLLVWIIATKNDYTTS